MKSKITAKLIGYFSAVLLLFALVIGISFLLMFHRHAMNVYKDQLVDRTVLGAKAISEERGQGMMRGQRGMYLQFLGDISGGDVWLVDQSAQNIQLGHMGGLPMNYSTLPDKAKTMIDEVYQGETVVSEEFSPLFHVPSLTVGTPVSDSRGKVIGALLIHSPVAGANRGIRDGYLIMALCMVMALILSAFLATILARNFIRPLRKMEVTATSMMQGDYTARTGVHQQDEIGSLAQSLDALGMRLEDASKERQRLDKIRDDFVSNISHELRTPVTVLRGSLEVLNEGLIQEEHLQKEYYQSMLTDTLYLQRLVDDLLELSRLQNMDFHIEKSPLDMAEVLDETVRSMNRLAREKNIHIDYTRPPSGIPFSGDYARLRQMFTAVLENGVKFSPENAVLTVLVEETEDSYLFSVCDKGPGIAPQDLPRIFDRFFRIPSEINKSGTGLGLSIAKQIAVRHDINLTCTSQLGVGTCFVFQGKK